jgi:hypothetical protein
MTFIEMLQQGGYILPQYSSGQQTYQAPNNGMQALQTMMAIDQGANQRYMQGEQLNLQKSQNTQNIIDSSIRNKISLENNERLKKQMDLSNAKLEFQMQKELLDYVDADREKTNSMFITRDKVLLDKMYADAGLDDGNILKTIGSMKGTQGFGDVLQQMGSRKALAAGFKNGMTNMQTYSQAGKLVKDTNEQLDRAQKLMSAKIPIDTDIYSKYIAASQQAADDTIKFERGELQSIDFNKDYWKTITGLPDFLNDMEYKNQLDLQQQADKQDIQNKILTGHLTQARTQGEIEDVKQAQIMRPIKQMTESLNALGDISKNFGLINGLKQFGINRNPSDIAGILEDINKLSPEKMQGIATMFEEERLKQQQTKTEGLPNSMNEEIARRVNSGELTVEEGMKLLNTKESTVNYTTDSAGRQGATDSKGVTNYGGYKTDSKGWLGGTYGGKYIEAKYIKDDLEKNSILPQADGSLKINGTDKVMKLFGIEATSNWGFGNWDEDDIKKAIPNAKQEGTYWIIPPDDIALPTATENSGEFFAPQNASGSTTISPNNPFLK